MSQSDSQIDRRENNVPDRAVGAAIGSKDWLFSAALVVAVFLVYQPAWQGGFLWDDDQHVTKPELRSARGLVRIWFEVGATQQYYPLTHSLFWIEHKLWGDAPLGYHLVNIALHCLSALLVLRILRRLEVPGAFWAAAIFALHPVQVESVAWISELKNTLSTAFCLASLLAYLRFDRTRAKPWYALALVLFGIGLLSKTVTAVLPAALLVIFWWRRGRLSWRRDVLPLLPWFVLGVAAGAVTAWVERRLIGAEGAEFDFSFPERLLISGRAVWFYLGKLFWPADLVFIYPRWAIHQASIWQYLYPLSAFGLLLALWLFRNRTRVPLAAALCYLGALFPVLGFFNVYPFRYSFVAGHFSYLASLPIIATVTAAIAWFWHKKGRPRRATATGRSLGVLFLTLLAMLSWQQSRTFGDAETLYQTTIARNPDCWLARNNLGALLVGRGQVAKAIAQYRKALEIKPDYAEAYNNVGAILASRGNVDEAIAYYQKALEINPDDADAHNNLALALAGRGEIDEAIAQFQNALKIRPDFGKAQNNLGTAMDRRGQVDEAIAHYRKALESEPDYVNAQRNLAAALDERDKLLKTIAQRHETLQIRPNDAALLNDLAWMLATNPNASVRNGADAVAFAQRALPLGGDRDPAVLDTLAAAYAEAGRFSEAINAAKKAITLARDQRNDKLAEKIAARLALYEGRRAYRDSR
jgi:tetratricopeptide (TPR) repeat protein